MSQRPEHPVVLVVEELLPGTSLSALNLRMLGFKRAGVREYWAVDPEYKAIYPHQLNGPIPPPKLPEDFQEMTAKFFASPDGQ
jgi:Uma2 family endonuclease